MSILEERLVALLLAWALVFAVTLAARGLAGLSADEAHAGADSGNRDSAARTGVAAASHHARGQPTGCDGKIALAAAIRFQVLLRLTRQSASRQGRSEGSKGRTPR